MKTLTPLRIDPMNATLLSSCLLALLVCAPTSSRAAPSDEGSRPRVLLEADSSELGKRGTGLDEVVLEHLAPALEDEGIDTSGSINNLGARVHILPIDVESLHYSIIFELEQDGAYAQVLAPVDCKPCIDATLFEKIDARAPAFADLIKARFNDELAADAGTQAESEHDLGAGDEPSEAEPDPAPAPEEPRPKIIGPLGYAGIGLATLGLGVTIVGGVELGLGRRYSTAGTYELMGRDHRPAGYALLGIGGAVLITGAALLTADLVRRKRQRTASARPSVRLVPMLSPNGAALGAIGHF